MPLQVLKLGEPKAGDEAAVSALAFSLQGSMLAVGHADGDIAFWELRRGGFECIRRSSGDLIRPCHLALLWKVDFHNRASQTNHELYQCGMHRPV